MGHVKSVLARSQTFPEGEVDVIGAQERRDDGEQVYKDQGERDLVNGCERAHLVAIKLPLAAWQRGPWVALSRKRRLIWKGSTREHQRGCWLFAVSKLTHVTVNNNHSNVADDEKRSFLETTS